jgi:hypothetical protein
VLTDTFRQIASQIGFITAKDVKGLRAALPMPRMQVLVRCGQDRFMCGLDSLEAHMAEVERKGDYVRDVCVPASPHPTDWIAVGYNPSAY